MYHVASALALAAQQQSKTLAEELGFTRQDIVLIINGDDVGMCHTGNLAAIDCMERGLMTTATIMMPCPWVPEIAKYAKAHPEKDFGLHLTHTSEWQDYRWGPVAPRDKVKGLLDKDGYLWRDDADSQKNATPQEAYIEAKAQIDLAYNLGIDVTHLDSHMGTLQTHPEFYKVYVKLAVEYNLPLRMGSKKLYDAAGFPTLRDDASKVGIVYPDNLIHQERPGKSPIKPGWMEIIRGLQPGVHELYIHAGHRTDEMKAITGSWEVRSQEKDLFTDDADMRALIKERNIKLIGFRPLRDLQRRKRAAK
jgi:predicted glycoside hydrolase/deacetylase ChbG (UPF0249 family)